ncbi:Phage terminase, large subunit GpA [Faunimonas pinastri]|uniref:Phage terminase, large subunit GpA n=1 Tax=Faunimonas pinastri TaxID=1855383 RepID=A0A1H9QET3_9HYPH|nr:phage terminase large subunit family protein [Faunimonas pinastri]SER58685.1 Phage terminase, large subunit GpA [Faunimonas pinastri]
MSEWAGKYAFLSAETSADAGKFQAFGYQNGIMDAVTDPTVKQITVMKSARVGYTKILDHVVGYFIHQDPSPQLIVQPRVEDAEDYSRTEIAPMLRDTPVLAEIAGDLKAKDSNQRILKRVFRNGSSVSFVGANSPGGFRRITARIIAFDEVDGYPADGAGNEGDQIALGTKRSESFWNRKIILGSTPTVKGVSRIEKAWAESDQRRYFVPCPHCGHMQVLQWANLHWDKNEEGAPLPETAHFVCEAEECRERIEEHDKPAMIDAGEWRAGKPFNGHAGFHIWAGYSLFPNAAWARLVEEWLRVHKDPALLRTFVNLVLGETWEEGEGVESANLITRAEVYGPDDLPDEVRVITGFCDVQGDRLEAQLIGWGADEECWPFVYEVINQDPAQPQAWKELDALLLRRFVTASGRKIRVGAFGIDTGGHHGAQVYSFCRARKARRIFPTKGRAGKYPMWPTHASKSLKTNDNVWLIGVDAAKEAIYARLAIAPGEDGEHRPGLIHFPTEEGFGPDYFEQLTSERRETRYKAGVPYTVWVLPPGKRNEVLDTFVGALAVRRSLPRRIEQSLEYAVAPDAPSDAEGKPKEAVRNRFFQARPLARMNDPYL